MVVDGDDAFFHGLQQRRLRSAGGSVELISEEEIAEDGALLIIHLTGFLVIDREARDVRGQNVRRKLDTVIIQAESLGNGDRHGGFSDTGNILHENMSSGDDSQKNLDQRLIFPDDDLADLADNQTRVADGIDIIHEVAPEDADIL